MAAVAEVSTQVDGPCVYTVVWAEGHAYQRSYVRTAPSHDRAWVTSEYSGEGRETSCRRCGA